MGSCTSKIKKQLDLKRVLDLVNDTVSEANKLQSLLQMWQDYDSLSKANKAIVDKVIEDMVAPERDMVRPNEVGRK